MFNQLLMCTFIVCLALQSKTQKNRPGLAHVLEKQKGHKRASLNMQVLKQGLFGRLPCSGAFKNETSIFRKLQIVFKQSLISVSNALEMKAYTEVIQLGC